MKRQLDQVGADFRVIEACDGRDPGFPFQDYRHLVNNTVDPAKTFSPTTFACYLSHAKFWRELLASSAPYALVLEDDMQLNAEAFRSFDPSACPEHFDFVYVNSRPHRWLNWCAMLKFSRRVRYEEKGRKMGRLHRRVRNLYYRKLEHLIPADKAFSGEVHVRVSDVLFRRLKQNLFSIQVPSSGTDGYFISRKGAAALLDIMESRGINNSAIDHVMQFHSLTADHMKQLKQFPESALPVYLKRFLDAEQEHIPAELQSYVYSQSPLVYLSTLSAESDIRSTSGVPFGRYFNLSEGEGVLP